jgi:hypothetical protein
LKMMMSDLCKITNRHKNTIYNLIRRGVIQPVEIISGIKVFDDNTVEAIKKHYEEEHNKKLCKLVFNDSMCGNITDSK